MQQPALPARPGANGKHRHRRSVYQSFHTLALYSGHSRSEARADVFDYIERFYNPRRRHSKLGYLSLMEFEARAMIA
jgi:transposase InsO family protein